MLAVVTVFVPNLPQWVSPVALSVLVIGFAVAWPVMVRPTPRWGISAVLAFTGLSSVWTVTLLPAHVEFSPMATELWLAPVGGAAALGVLLIFGVQTFSLPGGPQRFLSTAMFSLGAVIAATAAGWAMLLRQKYEVAQGAIMIERFTGLTWLMLTILVSLAVAALATLLPTRRRNRMIAVIVGATVVAVIMQIIRAGVLSVPAVIGGALGALIIALADSFSETKEAPAASLKHPLTAIGLGTGVTIVAGMVGYFVLHVLPW
ncbi:hypothetical protein FB556_2655 [Enteractinococcus coprophilus]|uniref:Uncharacterized protein n=1 Tax=Enteractinococcus coprophilus TaxID=1027633 RepID=A0A542ZYN5_9MICC|nr:hypothetical protein FB556_2655 [Enteractinococcus coprophilus]